MMVCSPEIYDPHKCKQHVFNFIKTLQCKNIVCIYYDNYTVAWHLTRQIVLDKPKFLYSTLQVLKVRIHIADVNRTKIFIARYIIYYWLLRVVLVLNHFSIFDTVYIKKEVAQVSSRNNFQNSWFDQNHWSRMLSNDFTGYEPLICAFIAVIVWIAVCYLSCRSIISKLTSCSGQFVRKKKVKLHRIINW